MPKLFTLSKQERLKSKKDIETLFQHGKAFFIYPFKTIYRFTEKQEQNEPLQFMATAPKKHFRKATARNRIRRQMKEAYRLQKNDLAKQLSEQSRSLQMIIIYQSPEALSFNDIYQRIGESLLRLTKLIPSNKEIP